MHTSSPYFSIFDDRLAKTADIDWKKQPLYNPFNRSRIDFPCFRDMVEFWATLDQQRLEFETNCLDLSTTDSIANDWLADFDNNPTTPFGTPKLKKNENFGETGGDFQLKPRSIKFTPIPEDREISNYECRKRIRMDFNNDEPNGQPLSKKRRTTV